MVYTTYTMEYYSAIKKEWNKAVWSNMDGPRNYHIKWSKSDRERQISYAITCMWNLKYNTNDLICKTEIDSDKFMVTKGDSRGWEGEIY